MTADTEPPREGLLEVGRIARSHGLRGEVLADVTSDRAERTEPGSSFETTVGTLTVVESRRHQARWLLRLRDCESRERADELRGVVLWAEPIEDDDTLWVHELVGCSVVDPAGVQRGEVTAVVANPAADLLELSDGTLVPLTFVLGRPTDGVITVDAPDGLFDL